MLETHGAVERTSATFWSAMRIWSGYTTALATSTDMDAYARSARILPEVAVRIGRTHWEMMTEVGIRCMESALRADDLTRRMAIKALFGHNGNGNGNGNGKGASRSGNTFLESKG